MKPARHHHPRHALPRARRRRGPATAWVGVLAVAGFTLSPEPAAPAAQLETRWATTTTAVATAVDEPHHPWQADVTSPAAVPAVSPVGARWGTDIGWPQCGRALPDLEVDFTVIQVTHGRPGTVSPCLAEQVAWARSVRSVLNAYVVPGSPSAADLAAADRGGACRGKRSCLLRAAGAADAAHALAAAEAAGLTARGWWLDVEDVPERTLWGTDTDANTQVLTGWRDELRRAGKQVGVYSTRGYWRQVVGRWQADLPQWPAVGLAGVDAARRACGRPFTSGPVLFTQWLTGPLDGNVLCPGQDRLAEQFFGHFSRRRTAGVPALLVIPVPHPEIEAALRAQAEREARQAEQDRKAEQDPKAEQDRQPAPRAGTGPSTKPPPASPMPAPSSAPPAEPAPTTPTPSPTPTSPTPAPSTGTGPDGGQRSPTGT